MPITTFRPFSCLMAERRKRPESAEILLIFVLASVLLPFTPYTSIASRLGA